MNTFLDRFWIGFGRGIEDGNSRIEMVVFISLPLWVSDEFG
jgi:hypothetical protein